jgi:hypothetical protein
LQAYATAEMAPAAELRILDRRPTIPDGTNQAADAGKVVLDQLLGQLADLVAAKVAARLATPKSEAASEWMDTRRAAEYLGIHRDSLRRLAAEGTIPAEQARAASCSSGSRIWTHGGGPHPESPSWLIRQQLHVAHG